MRGLELRQPDLSFVQHALSRHAQVRRTDTSVQNHDRHIGLYSFTDLHHLLEQLRLLLVPSGCIHNDHLKPLLLELRHALRGDRDRVRLSVGPEVRNLGLGSRLSSLVEGTSTEGIGADDA